MRLDRLTGMCYSVQVGQPTGKGKYAERFTLTKGGDARECLSVHHGDSHIHRPGHPPDRVYQEV